MNKDRYLKHILILVFLSCLCFVVGNGVLSLTNPDEVFYAQTAKEMIQHHSWMTPYLFGQPQFEKPILLYWLLRIGFILFGISSFGARLFPAIFAGLGVIATYLLALVGFKNEKKAFLCSLILMSFGIYIGLARSVFTDLIFSVFILFSLASFFWSYVLDSGKKIGIFLFFIFSAFAVLTKGPLGFFIPMVTVSLFLLIKKDIKFLLKISSLYGFGIFLLIALPWYFSMWNQYGNNFVHEFFYNDHLRRLIEAEHRKNDTWYFYPLSTLSCIFPWSLFLVFSFLSLFKKIKLREHPLRFFLVCWIVAVFIIFQAAHSKLVSYIFPLFPALAIIIGDFIYDKLSLDSRSRLIFYLSLFTNFFIFLIPIGLIIAMFKFPSYISSRIPIYSLSAVLLIFSALNLFFMLKNKLSRVIGSLLLVVPLSLVILFSMHNDIEPYISSKKACEYLVNNHKLNNIVLCSKFYVRGVRYYTGKEVAVIDISGKQFFSPHPVIFLDTDLKVRNFLLGQSVTYCILKKGAVEDIKRIANNGLELNILNKIGDEYIVEVDQSKAKGLI
ncbi:glycosyltransferase family 39 protein [bacterium]|nr:MAG: glycosyltransferase family 39 protein [bacterium]